MARKRKNSRASKALQQKAIMREHIAALRISNEVNYLTWCGQHGFRVTLNKSNLRRREELRFFFEHSAFCQLKISRAQQRFAESLIAFCSDHTRLKTIRRSDDERLTQACQSILKRLRSAQRRLDVGSFFAIVDSRSDLLECKDTQGPHPYIEALITIASCRRLWVRTIESWKPCTYNTDRQLVSLVRHLLAKYSVPAFFDSAWFDHSSFSRRCQRWYIQIALGQNPRQAESPVPLTKKMAHHLMSAPANCSVIQAVRWGQIMALGGDVVLFDAVRNSRMAHDLNNNEFWLSVLQFFVNHPLLDRVHVVPIVDYLHFQKFEQQVIQIENYDERRLPPPQPRLSMKGRTPQVLLAQVAQWHALLGRGDGLEKYTWPQSTIEPMTLIAGKGPKTLVWKISQLLSHKALAREGAAMNHCVVSYARSCKNQHCTIWSMTSEDVSGQIRRRQTIEVRKGKIVQSRGAHNCSADEREKAVLERWAAVAELAVDLPSWYQ